MKKVFDMKMLISDETAIPHKLLYARYRPKSAASKVTRTVLLRCRQCEKTRTLHFGPKWKPPSEGIMAMCKQDKCLTHTIHDFVEFVPSEKK